MRIENGNEVSNPIIHKKMACYINHIHQQNIKKPYHKVCLEKDHKVGKQTLEVTLNCKHKQKGME